jgi:hypothetical protein
MNGDIELRLTQSLEKVYSLSESYASVIYVAESLITPPTGWAKLSWPPAQ